jgi:hypothetical protein
MRTLHSKALAATAIATLMLVSPVPFDLGPTTLGVTAAHAGNGKGNGNGGGNGNGNSSTAHENKSSGSGKGATGDETVTADTGKAKGDGNLHAKLGGLNSLKRNINGLMNSSDPRMEDIRAFVEASADLAAAKANLETAGLDLAAAASAYNLLAASLLPAPYDGDTAAYADPSLEALQARLTLLNGLYATDPVLYSGAGLEAAALETVMGILATSGELAALAAAEDTVAVLTAEVAAGEAATTDEMLIEALMVAANDNRVAQYGDGYVDPQLLDWAKQQLGVGDYTGLIDAYISKL